MTSIASLLLLLAVVPAPSPAAAREAAREVLRDGYQTELPTPEAAAPSGGSASGDAPHRPRRTDGEPPTLRRESPRGGGGEALLWLLYAVLAVFLGLALFSVVRDRRFRPAPATAPPPAAKGRSAPVPPASPGRHPAREPWEALAGEGRFDEAVHALLLAAIADLRRGADAPPDSLTSREILRSPRVPEAALRALGPLVGAVERSLFGGRPAGREEYESSRAHLAAWRRALAGAAA